MSDIFCKIIAGEIKTDVVAEGKDWIAINDIHPKAPVHVLIVPRKHIDSLAELEDGSLGGSLMLAAGNVAQQLGIDKTGFRVMINHGRHGGQEVQHLHLHVMGGKQL